MCVCCYTCVCGYVSCVCVCYACMCVCVCVCMRVYTALEKESAERVPVKQYNSLQREMLQLSSRYDSLRQKQVMMVVYLCFHT